MTTRRRHGWCATLALMLCWIGLDGRWMPAAVTAAEPVAIDLLGRGLEGWTVDGASEADDGGRRVPVWTCADGIVTCLGKGFGFLRYDQEYSDFRLELEYRFPKKGNSGIGIRTGTFTGVLNTRPSVAAYEVQLLSDAGTKPGPGSCASLYRYVGPHENVSKPIGEWNSMVIECRGPRVRIVHNGVEVIDFDQSSRKDTAGKPLRGHVCLQNHGSRVEFRNIRIANLAAHTSQ